MDSLISILLIDDDEEDYIITRDLIEEINHKKYTLDWADNYAKGLELLVENQHDVYLIDFRLNMESGLDLIREAKSKGCECPLILLTGEGRIEIDEQALKIGASDYLVKNNLTSEHLERSIRYSIQNMLNLQQIKLLNQDLEQRVTARTEALALAIKDLERINFSLEKEVKERKAAEDALVKSQDELEQALEKEKQLNEMKSRFVSLASHEFRTPLSTIMSSASLIEKYTESEQQDKRGRHVSRIKNAVHNLTHILNDFLSIEKLDEGIIQCKPSEFNIQDVVEQVLENMRPQVKSGQRLDFLFKGDTDVVFLDKQLITNILINLLSNAIKYSPEGKPAKLIVEVKEADVLVTVSDEGIGIPKAEQTHLFERFFRAHNVTNIQGTGLGLSIVKRYVELMNGSISFESSEQKGTTFYLTFPIKTYTL